MYEGYAHLRKLVVNQTRGHFEGSCNFLRPAVCEIEKLGITRDSKILAQSNWTNELIN